MAIVQQSDINRLAIPSIIAGISEPLISFADTAIIGHIGTSELAGVGIASSFYLTLLWILSASRSVFSSYVAIHLKESQSSHVIKVIQQGIQVSFISGGGLYVVSLLSSKFIFSLYGAQGDVLAAATSFFDIRSLALPLNLATLTIWGIFRGMQNTIWMMWITLSGGLINIIFDLVLVYGIPGIIPSFGIEGAAIATVIAHIFMLVVSSYFLMKKCAIPFGFSFPFLPEVVNLLKLGLDMIIRTASVNVAYYMANRYATLYGKEYIAAHTIAMNIWFFSAFFIDGYSNAAIAISGKLKGENDKAGLYILGIKTIKSGIYVALFLSVVYALLYFLIPAFFTPDKLVIDVFLSFFWMVILIQPFNAVAFTLDGFFRGINHTRVLRNTLTVATFVVFIPTLYISHKIGGGMHGIWLCFFGFIFYRAARLLYIFLKEHKQ